MSAIETPASGPTVTADRELDGVIARLRAGNLLSGETLAQARLQCAQSNVSLLTSLSRLNGAHQGEIADAVAEYCALPRCEDASFEFVDLDDHAISLKFLKTSLCCPMFEREESIAVALVDPVETYLSKALEMAFDKPIQRYVATPAQIERVIERYYENSENAMTEMVDAIEVDASDNEENIARLIDLASETPVVRLVNALISRAVDLRASDIHIEPFDASLKVRYRIDGILSNVDAPPARSSAAVISRLKIMARLDIAERRTPQDGRIQIRVQGKLIDLRVSTVPTMHGESVVLRILDKESLPFDFSELGFHGQGAAGFLEALSQPHGIVLATGPTGSGKTTTLYAALQRLNTPEKKILTVEDPVEYQLEGINQIQVKPQIDLTFAAALRSIVRQDPDVIMIGEMRDLETASIAVQSALTGHLVLSTLHTNDAASTVTRLLDMGVEDYLLSSTINGIVAQRLVRTLCLACAEPYEIEPRLVDELGLEAFAADGPPQFKRAVGCDHCAKKGYYGRSVIFEFLAVTDPIRKAMLSRADSGTLLECARASGMRSMREDGFSKVVRGITTLEEVLRVTQNG